MEAPSSPLLSLLPTHLWRTLTHLSSSSSSSSFFCICIFFFILLHLHLLGSHSFPFDVLLRFRSPPFLRSPLKFLHSLCEWICPLSYLLGDPCRPPCKTVQNSTERSKVGSPPPHNLRNAPVVSHCFLLLHFRQCSNKNVARRIKTKKLLAEISEWNGSSVKSKERSFIYHICTGFRCHQQFLFSDLHVRKHYKL